MILVLYKLVFASDFTNLFLMYYVVDVIYFIIKKSLYVFEFAHVNYEIRECTCNEIVSQTNSPLVFSFLKWKTYVKFVLVSISSKKNCRYLSIIFNLMMYFIQPQKFI